MRAATRAHPPRSARFRRIAALVANWKSSWEDSWPVRRLVGVSADGTRTGLPTKEGKNMSEDEARKDEDEVEAHHSGGHKLANDEDTTEGSDDFELHHRGGHKLANDEGDADGDDF